MIRIKVCGMHKKKHFMSIVTVDQCQLVHDDFNVILRGVLDFASSRGYSHLRTSTGIGVDAGAYMKK